jgi:hypothetical protein
MESKIFANINLRKIEEYRYLLKNGAFKIRKGCFVSTQRLAAP